jgi:recombination protein RecA
MVTNPKTKNRNLNNDDLHEKRLRKAMAEVEKICGAGSIMALGDNIPKDIDIISTGSIILNRALGIGGLPVGRVVEVFGPESSGKTTLALSTIAQAQKKGIICAFIDAEHAMDLNYAEKLGVKPAHLLLSQPDYGEQALNIVDTLIQTGNLGLIVVDSVAALVPKAELDGEMIDQQMGLQARMMSKAMRKITAHCSKFNTTVLFINQIRMKIGIVFGSPEVTPGGQALKFFSSVRLDIRKTGTIKNGEDIIGNRIRIKVIKNKVAPPFKIAETELYYHMGICPVHELVDIALRDKTITKSGSWYSFGDKSLGQGKEKVVLALLENSELHEQIKNSLTTPL